MQNAQGISFTSNMTMGDGATLNVTNSTGAISTGAVGLGLVRPFTLSLGQTSVDLPTTGSQTVTFNVAGPGEVLSVGQASAPVTLQLGPLNDGGGATPATINIAGGGSVITSSFVFNLNSPQINVNNGGNLVVHDGGIGSTAKVNVTAGSTLAINGAPTVSQLTGTGSVLLNSAGSLTIGSSTDNLNNAVSNGLSGDGVVQNGGSNNTLTLNGGNFASTAVNSNSSSTVPGVIAGNTMALGNTVTLNNSGILRLMPTPGTATLAGFGNNYGVPDQNGFAGAGVVSNGWTINSSGFVANGATNNTVAANLNIQSGTPYTAFPAPNVLQLTNGGGGESRTAFYNTPVAYANGTAGFTASFTYTAGMQAQADGMTFIIQNDPNGAGALGGVGANANTVASGQGAFKGYGGIANSIAIELDVFQNGSPGGVGTALAINGSNTPVSLPVKWLADGDPINVTVSYSPTAQTITETLVDTLVPANVFSTVYTGVNLSAILGKPTAYVGFGGATGGQFVDQLISNFSYSVAAATPASYATNVAMNGTSTIDLAATAATPTFSTTGGLSSSGGTLTISATTASSSSLNYGLTFNGPSSLSGTVTVNPLNAGPGGAGTGVGTVTFASQVSGAGGIANIGPGNVVLGALNTFTGGVTAQASTTIVTAPGGLSSGAVTLAGGTLKLSTPQPYSAPVVLATPIAATGWNQDVVVGANQTPSVVFSSLSSFDGAGVSHAPGNVLFQMGTPGSPAGSGLPVNGVIGDVTTPNAFSPNVTFQLQPYSTATGGLVNNDLQLNNVNLSGQLSLATPGKYSSISVLHATGNGPGGFEMQLNFTDAAPLMVGSGGGANSTTAGPGILSPDWFNNAGSVFPLGGVGRYGGGTNFNGQPGNPRLYEYDYSLPLAYQNATLESITFDYGTGGQINIMGVSGTQLTTSNLNAVNVTADSTIDVTGTASSGLGGLTTIGNNTLTITGGSTGLNAPYTLSLGTSGGVTLSGNPTFNVSNNGSGTGTLVLGSLNDGTSARTLTFSGSGATTLNAAATSLVAGTIVNISAGSTLNSNAAGTAIAGGSLGQFAQVNVGAGATFGVGASQTISSVTSASGTSKLVLTGGTTLGIGNADNLASSFSGVISDVGPGVGSINVGVSGSTGSLTLSNAANTYQGTTRVTGGTLFLQTAGTNNIANSSSINVPGGTLDVTGVTGGFTVANGQTLQGASILGGPGGGSVNGGVTVGNGAKIAGTSTTSTSLTISGPLTLQVGSASNFTLLGSLAGTTPLITANGGLSVTGANAVNIASASVLSTVANTFRLYGYTGTQLSAGQFNNFSISPTFNTPTLTYSLQLLNDPNAVDLAVTPNGLTWAALVDQTWTNSTGHDNWVTAAGVQSQFATGQQAIFADSYPTGGGGSAPLSTPQNISVDMNGVTTNGLTFAANSVAYNFTNASGTVGITGPGGVALLGTAPVTFNSDNTFTGVVQIAAGQLNLASGNAIGMSSGVTVASGASLNLATAPGGVTFAAVPVTVSGTGSGATGVVGALNSSAGANTYSGIVTVGTGGATIGSTSIAAGDGLTLSNTVTNGNSTPATLTFAGAGNTTVSGSLTDGGTANALSITLTGPGNLILSGSNTYHGGTTDPGLLVLKSANSLGNSSGVTVSSTGGLVLNAGATTGLAATGGAGIPLSIAGTGTNTVIPGTAVNSTGAITDVGTNTYGGPITLTADSTVATTAGVDALTLSGTVAGGTFGTPFNLNFIGAGSTTVSGSILNGNLLINTTANAATATSGSVTLSGTANIYSGSTAVNTGALILKSASALGSSSGATVASGAALVLNNAGTTALTFGTRSSGTVPLSLTGAGTAVGGALNGFGGALIADATNATPAAMTYSGGITINAPGATIATTNATDNLTLSGAINSTGATMSLTGPGTTTIGGAVNLTMGGILVPSGGNGTYTVNGIINDFNSSPGGTVAMSGSGTLNLNTVNVYSGNTTVGGGVSANTGTVVSNTTVSLGTSNVQLNGGILQLKTTAPGTSGFPGTVGATGQAITGWTINNTTITTTPLPVANTLQLTDSIANEARSAIFNTPQPINSGFTAKFTYTPSAGTAPRADGATFVIETAGTGALGGAGGSLGYFGIANPNAAFEMNIYNGHVIGTNFEMSPAAAPGNNYHTTGGVNFNSGDPISVALVYDAATTTLTETDFDTVTAATFTTSYTDDIAGNLGTNVAFIGFTGGTGGSNSTQQISNFSFTAGSGAGVYTNALFMNAGTTSTIQVLATAAAPTITTGPLTVNSGAASTLNVAAAAGTPANQAYGLTVGPVTLNADPTFSVANNGTGTGTLTLEALNDSGSPRTITVNGAGRVLLNAVATSLGSTSAINVGGNTVNTGNLVVTNAIGSPTGTAAINVNQGGTLSGSFATSGTGSIAGLVTVNSGGTILGSNAAALAGNPLNISGNLTINGVGLSPSFSSYALTTTPNVATPPTTNKGMIVANGGLNVTGVNTVKLTGSVPALLATNTYDLIDYSGTVTSTQNGANLTFGAGGAMNLDAQANLPAGGAYLYSLVNNATLKEIDLIATPNQLTWTGQTGGNGAVNGTWDVGASTNWATKGNVATTFANSNAVVFADKNPITAANVPNTAGVATVTIASTGVKPGLVAEFTNTGATHGGIDYVLTGGNNIGIADAGAINNSGATNIIVDGTGAVTFSSPNSFSGAVQVLAGQLNLADTEVIGSANFSLGLGQASGVVVSSGATLQLQATPAGTAVKFGNAYNGGGLVSGSLLAAQIPLTLNGTGLTGGALNAAGGNDTYSGATTIGASGATIASSSAAAGDGLTLSGAMSITPFATVTFAGAGPTTVSGVISDGGAASVPGSLVMSGANTLTLSGANTYFGNTTISTGNVTLTNATALGNSSGVSVASGAAMTLSTNATTPTTFGNFANGSATIPLTLNGAGIGAGSGALVSTSGTGGNIYAGPVSLATSSSIATTSAASGLTLSNSVSGGGLLTVNGPGTVTLSGNNSYGGGTTLNHTGTVVSSNISALGSGNVTLNSTGVLRVFGNLGAVRIRRHEHERCGRGHALGCQQLHHRLEPDHQQRFVVDRRSGQ